MLVHVAVADPLASYAHGLTSRLRASGISAETPADLEAWAGDNQAKIIFLTLASERDWQRLEALRLLDDRLLIVAVMDVMDQTACVRALTAGAVSILPRDAAEQAVLEIVDSLAKGQSIVPLPVMRALVRAPPPDRRRTGGRASAVVQGARLATGTCPRRDSAPIGKQRWVFRENDVPNITEPLQTDERWYPYRSLVSGAGAWLDLKHSL